MCLGELQLRPKCWVYGQRYEGTALCCFSLDMRRDTSIQHRHKKHTRIHVYTSIQSRRKKVHVHAYIQYMYIPLFRVDVVNIGGTVHSRLHQPLVEARKFLTSPHSRWHCYIHLDYSHTQILLQYNTMCSTRECATTYRAVSVWLGLISTAQPAIWL